MSGYGNRVLILVVAALLPVALLATGWVLDASQAASARTEEMIRSAAERVRDRLDDEIKKHIAALNALAAAPAAQTGDWDAFARQALVVDAQQLLWRNVLVTGRDGRQVLNLYSPRRLTTPASPETFRQVLATGRPAVTPFSVGRGTGYPGAAILVPVPSEGEIRYVLSGVLDMTVLAEMFRGVVPPRWRGSIIDSEGNIVVRSSDGTARTGQPGSPSGLAAIREGREGELRTGEADGNPLKVLHLRSAVTGWTVHVGLRLDDLSVLQTRSLDVALAGGAASLGLAVLLSALLLRELRERRRDLTARANRERLEAIGRITGGVAHDFNNLLTAIIGAALAIKQHTDAAMVAPFADTVLSAASRGATITKQLLGYARRERHEPAPFALADRAAEIQLLLQHATRGDIRIDLAIERGLWTLYADAKALDVALINLAANARDAMPRGGTLTVRASNVRLGPGAEEVDGLNGDFVAIAVSDTGSGIAPKDLKRLFEPFFTTKPVGQGTGLGLAQVQGFAKQSGGTVTVASTMGEGTTFTVYMPRATQPVAAPPPQGPAASSSAVSARVLVVEDNDDVAKAMDVMLGVARFQHRTVHSAANALALLDAGEPFDIVLTDLMLGPGMSGIELASAIRERWPGLPVVLMTGYSDAVADGAADGVTLLAKPFGPKTLRAALEQAQAAARRAGSGT